MTPDKRLNQIEPVLADFVQKVDRLIEGNGQIINEASKIAGIEQQVAKIPEIENKIADIQQQVAKIPSIERTVAITAKGLAELTIRFDQFQQELSDVKTGQQLILQILREKLP